MNFKKLAAYVQLCRPVNVLITVVSIPVACWIAGGSVFSWITMLLAGMTGACVAAGANAINDAFDIEIDRINRPDRPLPRGALTRQDAWRMWFVLSLAAAAINAFFYVTALLIVLLSIAMLYVYSARLKRTVLIGNILIGAMTGMAFIYGGAVVGRIDRALMPALFAFLVNLARELLKDVEDMEGDRKEHAMTLPIRYGVRLALVVATATILVLIGTTIAVGVAALYRPAFFYMVIVADCLMGSSIFLMWLNHSSANNISRASTVLKGSMVIGLLSIIVGSM